MSRTPRRFAAGLLALAMGSATLATAPVALAHEDHGANPEPAAVDWENYEKTTLSKSTGEPIDLAVMPVAEGAGESAEPRVLHTARDGIVRMTDPETGITRQVADVPVYSNSEDGMQTVTLDPNFEDNGWVYLYYAPVEGGTEPALAAEEVDPDAVTPDGQAPLTLPEGETDEYWEEWVGVNRLSRFQWDEAEDEIVLDSEQQIIDVEVNRGQCCHVAGDVGFDEDGLLYLATGDNTPASAPGAEGFAPINDTEGNNPGFDTRRGAGNTNDLRGKILRIEVAEDGSYTSPDGNLFTGDDDELTRDEIFVMGLRNPFRMDVDPVSGAVTWGDYGPDSGTADPERGPMGYVEWQSTTESLNAGWPFCHGPNAAYSGWDRDADDFSGEFYDCTAPVNDSTLNDGSEEPLPTPVAPQIYYGDNPGDQPNPAVEDDESLPANWDAFVGGEDGFRNPSSNGQGPMGGPIYRYDESSPETAFPEYWDGHAFMSEFSQDYVAAIDIPDPDGPVAGVENFFPAQTLTTSGYAPWSGPMDIEFGPDGSMYVLEYGKGFFTQNPEAGLYRIDYAPGDKAPIPMLEADVTGGPVPLEVTFDASGSHSADSHGGGESNLSFEWDFLSEGGNEGFEPGEAQETFTYTEEGEFFARVRVTDDDTGRTAIASISITPGNTAPEIDVEHPPNGGFFEFGDEIPYTFTPTDVEDGDDIDCSRLRWQFGIGHDMHAHPYGNGSGCEGTMPTPSDSDHGETEKVFGAVVLTYTDNGAGDIPSASTSETVRLTTKLQQAEHADDSEGAVEESESGASGNAYMTLTDGSWLAYEPVNFQNITGVHTFAQGQGTLSLRFDDPAAEPFAEIDVDVDGAPADLRDAEAIETAFDSVPEGSGTVYLTATGDLTVDRFVFQGAGVSELPGDPVDPVDPEDPVLEVTRSPAEPDGSNGWYTGPVTFDFTAPEGYTVQVSPDAEEWTDLEGSSTVVDAEGVTTLHYRAVDADGEAIGTDSQTVQIDSVGPEVSVSGIEEGGTYGGSADAGGSVAAAPGTVTVDVDATDATSGVAAVVAEINGTLITVDEPISLEEFDAGPAELVVTVDDAAGNATTETVSFTIAGADDGSDDGTGDDGTDDGTGDDGTEDGTGDDGDDEDLPDTGGSLAGLGIGGLLVAAGVGLTLLRRRSTLTS